MKCQRCYRHAVDVDERGMILGFGHCGRCYVWLGVGEGVNDI